MEGSKNLCLRSTADISSILLLIRHCMLVAKWFQTAQHGPPPAQIRTKHVQPLQNRLDCLKSLDMEFYMPSQPIACLFSTAGRVQLPNRRSTLGGLLVKTVLVEPISACNVTPKQGAVSLPCLEDSIAGRIEGTRVDMNWPSKVLTRNKSLREGRPLASAKPSGIVSLAPGRLSRRTPECAGRASHTHFRPCCVICRCRASTARGGAN